MRPDGMMQDGSDRHKVTVYPYILAVFGKAGVEKADRSPLLVRKAPLR